MMSSRSAYTSQLEISDLPPEILPQIFKWLSTNERKSVKLVCHAWFQACNVFSLLNDELIICLGIYQLSDTYDLLERSPRGFLSLQFESVDFHDNSSFWGNNGHKIRSLDFINCTFHDGTLHKIMVYCVNLIHLSFRYTLQFINEQEFSKSPINENDLEKVVKSGIVRENLTSLEIRAYNPIDVKVSDYVLHQLFTIFPKVTMLKIVGEDIQFDAFAELAEDFDSDLSETSNKDRFTFAPVLNYLTAAADRIEILKLRFDSTQFTVNILQPPFIAMKKLTELSTNMHISPFPTSFEAIIFYSKHLKLLEFSLEYTEDIVPRGRRYTALKLKILFPHSSFKHLKIRCRGLPFYVSKADFEKLILFCSKNFNLSVQYTCTRNPDSFVPHLLARNKVTTLPDLSLQLHYSEEDTMPVFLQTLQNLNHLIVSWISDRNLELLLKSKMKLKSLIVYEHKENSRIIDQDRCDLFTNAFNQLTDVECLKLSSPIADIFVRCLSPEPILANLKYLDILPLDQNQLAFTSDFLRAADAMPFLEGLTITGIFYTQVVTFDFFVKLCSKLKRLRYFFYAGDQIVDDPFDYQKLFEKCPSLRALVLDISSHVGVESYFFDTINKKVQLMPSKIPNVPLVFRRPRVGDFQLSWLELR